MLKLLELRSRAKVALGIRFDLAEFHRMVLADGPMPLGLLEARVEAPVAVDAQAPLP